MLCFPITKASLSRWGTFVHHGSATVHITARQKSRVVGLIPAVGASMLVCPKKLAEKNSGDSQC